MTLDSAITYYEEIAKECRRKADIEQNDYMDMRDSASEAEQLASWLNELMLLRGRIDAQPTIEERKRGKWIDAVIPNDNGGLPVQVCDQCNSFFPLAYTGGADMRGKEGEKREK